ncbi:MAG: PhzF family phenazine biosynthesis protein [Salibacteraceae bacterium]|nr:PhzF family phenazine biosynthesis protein [Salibacteraceae bacterium]
MIEKEFRLINVFTSAAARGNQCCVLMLNDLSDEDRLLSIAQDFDFPATAFIKRMDDATYQTRWFAKEKEIQLCGHGAIATAWALKNEPGQGQSLLLQYNDGSLALSFENEQVCLSSEAIVAEESTIPEAVQKGFNGLVKAYFPSSNKHLVLLEKASQVAEMKPDWAALRTLDTFAYSITAPGQDCDFVSRTLLPFIDKLEDQATGSSHLTLAPFWAERLGKTMLHAKQLSERGGELTCQIKEEIVILKAHCQSFGKGQIE